MNYATPRTETRTAWHNPLDVPQRVDVRYGDERTPTRFEWPPHATMEVDSRFDSIIHRVQCEEQECRSIAPGFCTKNHRGVILGGAAPQLRREGSTSILAASLDPRLAEKQSLAAQVAAASIARTNQENAMMIAEARRLEIEAEEKRSARADAAAPSDAELEAMTRPDPHAKAGNRPAK